MPPVSVAAKKGISDQQFLCWEHLIDSLHEGGNWLPNQSSSGWVCSVLT